MKKNSLILFFLLYSIAGFSQQPTQAEIDKMVKQAQEQMKKYGIDTTVNKTMKGLQAQQKQMTDAMKNQQGNNKNNGVTNALYSSDPGSYGNVDNWKFPAKNTAMLASLPKKVFTKTELVI